MTVKIFPSHLPGEPLEVHEHGAMTLHEWFSKNVAGYEQDIRQPVIAEVNGKRISGNEWPLCFLKPDSQIKIYPTPYGTGLEFAAWAAIAVAVASAAYSIYMMSTLDTGGGTASGSDALSLNPAQANTAKLGDPIREVFGRYRIFPDYIVQPVSRFVDKTSYETKMFLCLGRGQFSLTNGDIKVGSTPISSFGNDFSYTVYPPGADVSSDERSENWFNSTEVGSTSGGGTGLDMGTSSPDEDTVSADAATFSGTFVSLIAATMGDNETSDLPKNWAEGTILTIIAPDTFTVGTTGLFSLISGGSLSELQAFVGMPVTLNYNGSDYDLYIASYSPAVEPIPGVGGSAAMIKASAAPSTYDFSVNTETFTLVWDGATYSVSLLANYANMSSLVDSVNTQLSNSGLVAVDNSGRLSIIEASSPYIGGSLNSSALPSSVFGASPEYISGTASSGGAAGIKTSITLAYDSATGTPFSGLPVGSERLAIGLQDNQYRITSTDALTITVSRLNSGVVDDTWQGFNTRTVLDFVVSGINDDEKWLGPFLACPENEITDMFEVDFSFPNGVCGFDSKGNKRIRHVEWEIQWRNYAEGNGWKSRKGIYAEQNPNGMGFNENFQLDTPGLVEVRCRRRNDQGSNNARDSMYWKTLRSRLQARPKSYAGVTTIGITFVTGSKVAAQSDRRINMVVTRNYDNGGDRTISGAIYHILTSLGFKSREIDREAMDALEIKYWTPRGETFDFSADSDDKSALETAQMITNAGMSYFLLSDGLASAGREGVKNWTGIISPQETTEYLQTAFSAPSQDDYGGVDVTYIDGTTWASETVQCRTPENPTPSKIEAYTLYGVTDRNRAYRIGMRRLMKYRQQRLTFTTTTEMDALCYNYGDRLVLTDDIPGHNTISSLIIEAAREGNNIRLVSGEPLDWSFANPRCLIRFQDGSASPLLTPTKVDEYTLFLPLTDTLNFDSWEMEDASIEPPRLIFCSSERQGYDALMTEITPSSDGTCEVTAREYKASFYDYDDAIYPGDVA
ncbi:kinase [Rouxiella silvae]|uniref:Kinase n=1 Tax=Rouxiella silvae TaxID=1646373 RepID=A0ABX3TX89_9GAMM|nr:host specificity factor TipJ family phage tail protein [Rouxiella silvae]ORJ19865.1 kinase [Rouxiella silvae]